MREEMEKALARFEELEAALSDPAGQGSPTAAQATADASFTRTAAWDAAAPESVGAFGSELPLSRQVRMRLDVSRMIGIDPQWRAGMSLAVPLD